MARNAKYGEQGSKLVCKPVRDRKRGGDACRRAGQGDGKGFAENQRGQARRPEAERLHRCILRKALASRHRHGVRHDRHDDEDHQEGDDLDGHDDGLGHRDEAELERLFRFRQRFGQRVPESLVYGRTDSCRAARLVDSHDIDTHRVGAARHRFFQDLVQVVPVKEKLRRVGLGVGAVVNGADDEIPGPGKNGPPQRHHVADLESILLCELTTDDAAFSIQQEGFHVLGRNQVLGIHRKIRGGIHGKLRKEVLLRDIDAAKPVRMADMRHPFDLPYPFAVGDRQREYEGD